MFPTQRFIRNTLLLSIMLLPVAHWKLVVFGIPLYGIEIPVMVACFAYGYGWKTKLFVPSWTNHRSTFFFGVIFFFGGALLSFFANPFSLTGLGMLKTWFAFPVLWAWLWTEVNPDSRDLEKALLGWFGISVLGACLSLMFFTNGFLTYDGRLEGWYASPNFLAFFLAPGVLLGSYFFLRPPYQYFRLWRTAVLFSLAVLVLALFLTRSYTVWVAVSVTLCFFLLFYKKTSFSWRKKMALILLVSAVFAGLLFFESGSEKWQSFIDASPRSSLASRMMIWKASFRIIADHPVLGIGIGRFQEVYLSYQQYFSPYLEWAVPQPHNLYLAVWLQTGIVGLLGFLLLVGWWMFRIAVIVRNGVSGAPQPIAALLIVLLMLPLIIGLADTPFFKTDLAFMFWYCIAFGIGFLNEQKNTKNRNESISGRNNQPC